MFKGVGAAERRKRSMRWLAKVGLKGSSIAIRISFPAVSASACKLRSRWLQGTGIAEDRK